MHWFKVLRRGALVASVSFAFGCIPSPDSVEFNASAETNNGASNNGASNNGASNNGETGQDAGSDPADVQPLPDGCRPENNAQFCQRLSAACGAISGTDNCGQARTADCGTCATGACQNNTCACNQEEDDNQFCSRLDVECGMITGEDLCGNARTAGCGNCAQGLTCADGQCLEAQCDDMEDNDGDGNTDCADPDCLGMMCADKPPRTCKADGACEK